jgi:hypothetical protein
MTDFAGTAASSDSLEAGQEMVCCACFQLPRWPDLGIEIETYLGSLPKSD